MNLSEKAAYISAITKRELGHLYYAPAEMEQALRENRGLILEENNRIVAFAFWTIAGGPPGGEASWYELRTLYIDPDFRGQGYIRKLFAALYERLKDEAKHAFFFTRSGAAAHVASEYGFRRGSYFDLPFGVAARELIHQLHPLRLLSYLKYGWKIFGVWKWELYIH